MRTLGLLHPGQMGASVGACARESGHRVLVALDGRTVATRSRAADVGLEDVGGLAELAKESELILAVCPPSAARELLEAVLAEGFEGIYVDANAISPATARELAHRCEGKARFVDGGIIGPPAHTPGTTRLHLSGAAAPDAAALFVAGPLDARVVSDEVGAASALKMVFAAWTKGSTALLAAIHAVAVGEGVEQALRAEWEILAPDVALRLDRGVPSVAAKAWRFEGEMREIAATFEAAGLPGGFHEAAAEVYRRLADFQDVPEPPPLAAIAAALRRGEE
ncbi:MAG: NAD(P)-dependent oxidoreductase [Deltaproteobacteria bacterium]|nr:NAD(P)-dependent oxidoreductase [Deltaproteobacteria bacterium]